MDFFTIDTVGTSGSSLEFARIALLPSSSRRSALNFSESSNVVGKPKALQQQQDSDDDDYGGLPPPSQDIFSILHKPTNIKSKPGTLQSFFDDSCSSTKPNRSRNARYSGTTQVEELAVTDVDQHMKAAVITPAVEKCKNLSALSMSDRKIKELSKKDRMKTKGKDWFNLPAQEMTEEVKNELELIRMRSVLDPKHFYKRSEMKTLPKYFQIGKVVDSPLDYYNDRGMKKSKAKTLVDELLEDAQFQKYNKKKYVEALEKRKKKAYHKAAIKMKKLKKKKK